MDYLQTDALSVGYNGKTLISKVALSVQRGRIVTLIGPNGSGKSTILKTIICHAPAKSRCKRRINALVMPQPGHGSPVISTAGQIVIKNFLSNTK